MYLSITHEASFGSFLERVPFYVEFEYKHHQLIEKARRRSAFHIIHSSLVSNENSLLHGVHNAMICCVFEWIKKPQKREQETEHFA